jgi:hypothetical protein
MDPSMSDIASRAGGSAIAKVGTSIIEKLGSKGIQAVKDQVTQIDLWSEYERRYLGLAEKVHSHRDRQRDRQIRHCPK